ncbi:DUF4157 domain-containing protein [Dyella subtropica]|uniref:eCIS core domain-containing protein n=1 Tax=Dyella subtropica TaxID=2992127 RepID=UPI0022517EF4|nr:DUF4157 domain-containing protein [Dyella subtropica]
MHAYVPAESLGIQRKSTVSSPGDPYELEADATADRVMRMALPTAVGSAPLAIQRKCAQCEEEEDHAIQAKHASHASAETSLDARAAIDAARQAGAPLPAHLRSFFEPRFGYDFSRVRVHTDAGAAAGARAVQARAFTAGHDIVFNAGEYVPDTHAGLHLLAHELTHVVQQSTNRTSAAPAVMRKDDKTCSIRQPLYGWDNIRNISRERLRAAGFVFCGPDRDFGDPDLWEKWVHPTKGVLHFQVKWKEDPPPQDPPADDRQKRCADPCMDKSDDEDSCKQCCEDTIPADDAACRRTCNVACSTKL